MVWVSSFFVHGMTKQILQPWRPSIRHEARTFVGPPMPCLESRLEEICWSMDSPPQQQPQPCPCTKAHHLLQHHHNRPTKHRCKVASILAAFNPHPCPFPTRLTCSSWESRITSKFLAEVLVNFSSCGSNQFCKSFGGSKISSGLKLKKLKRGCNGVTRLTAGKSYCKF